MAGRREESVKIGDPGPLFASPLAHLLVLRADLDGIGDQLGRLFLLQTRHFLQLDGDLRTKGGSEGARPLPALGPLLVPAGSAHGCLPAEDVAVEADPVFGEVESALKKNVSLECTGVICSRIWEMELRDREASQ